MRGHPLISAGFVILSGFTVALGEDLSKPGTDALIVNDYTIGAPIVAPQGNPYYFNWSDAPFKITLSESAGYNDNVLGLFNGQPSLPGIARGDMFSATPSARRPNYGLGLSNSSSTAATALLDTGQMFLLTLISIRLTRV